MGLFRCRDLLEVNTGEVIQNQAVFKLFKATESVAKIIELLCRDKNVKISIDYETGLRHAKFWGDVPGYPRIC